MSSIRKEILVGGNSHHVQIDSSLELEGIEITGTCPHSGKVVHISLSSLLKAARGPEIPPDIVEHTPTPNLDMFSEDFASGVQEEAKKEKKQEEEEASNSQDERGRDDDVINDIFS